MPKLFNNLDWADWFQGMIAAIISGGSTSVTSGIVLSSVDPTVGHTLAIGTWASVRVMFSTFVVSGLWAMFAYLQKNSMPHTRQVTVSDRTITQTESGVQVHSVVKTDTEPVEPNEVKGVK